MEPSSQTTVDPQSNSRALGVKDKPPTAGRASMDVDSFKRLLLTGNANSTSMSTASTVMPHPKPQFGLTGDSSSSTDTSSVSRQSIFEPVHEPAQESPRTSYELDLSDDDERSQLVEVGPKVPKKKPPLPKHRHGKLVSSRAPQTVSFADFSPSYAPQRDHSPSATSRRTVTRKPSDLNKPLPPPPISPGIQTEDMSSISPPSPEEKRLNIEPSTPVSPENSLPTSIAAPPLSASQDQPNPTPPLIDSPMQTKKTPPPVPLSRRHSQLRSSNPLSNRSRSNSTLTTSSLDGPPTRPDSIAEVTSPTSAFIPSPPPTIPRSIAETATPVQSTTTFAPPLTASLSTSTPSLVRAPSITESTSSRSKPPPPPPARRHRSASKTEQQASSAGPAAAASWSNSQLVLNSTQGAGAMSPPTSPQQTFQGVIRSPSVRSSMGPPPPPPPKRSSAKSSFEAQRPGLAELRRASTVSGTEGREEGLAGSEVRAGEGTSGSGGGVDILGDMEAFQREIDELRDRYRRGS
ncbi:hypothetical protein M501DRAFT_1004374 [Patellaria atrata CBS 101060]|uniref:Uncharacterized protein n=1 Tax=Patellaria atrata CBS 101060 TaxID=1346257 RepID=A0A9P4S9M6_9PEZI|nr:hypothetical protein M501DRAFT_1004374 [Patellaria atrata CBS 101060]